MDEDKTIERLRSEVTRLQNIIWEWEEYSNQVKAALGHWRYAAGDAPDDIALLAERADLLKSLTEEE